MNPLRAVGSHIFDTASAPCFTVLTLRPLSDPWPQNESTAGHSEGTRIKAFGLGHGFWRRT